jgi:hypothetical protein
LPRQETITPAGIDNNLELEEVRRAAEQSSPTPVSAAGIDRVTPEQEARAAQTASLDNPNDTTYAGPEPTPPAEEE